MANVPIKAAAIESLSISRRFMLVAEFFLTHKIPHIQAPHIHETRYIWRPINLKCIAQILMEMRAEGLLPFSFWRTSSSELPAPLAQLIA